MANSTRPSNRALRADRTEPKRTAAKTQAFPHQSAAATACGTANPRTIKHHQPPLGLRGFGGNWAKGQPSDMAVDNTITAGQAWQALGADPRYKPSRPERAANGPMLWRLNLHDRLLLVPVATPEHERDVPPPAQESRIAQRAE